MYIVGIDIGKRHHEASIIDGQGKVPALRQHTYRLQQAAGIGKKDSGRG